MYCPDFAIYGTKAGEPKHSDRAKESKAAGGEK